MADDSLSQLMAAEGASGPSGEARVRHADTSWRDVEIQAQDLLHTPSVGGVVLNVRDITERKHTEDALRRREPQVED